MPSKLDELSVVLSSPAQIKQLIADQVITPAELEALVISLERQRCMDDLFFLAHDVLGYTDLTESIHRPLCSVVQSVNPLIVGLSQRVGSKGVMTQAAPRVNNPNAPSEATSGRGGVGDDDSIGTQNFIKNFKLPQDGITNSLIEKKIIEFNPEARTRLFLLFRGAFKSTIITIAHTIQLMLIWPDIRILIASHKKEGGSQKFLGSIKDHFIRNERFRKLFPEFCPKPNSSGQIDWGTSEQVTLPNRSSTAIFPEATIEIAGNTTDVTGRHYNYLKIDDIVTRESVTNESMLERTEEFNALLTFLFDQPEWGIADYSGTCYHFADLYASLRNSPQITKFILPVWDENKVPTVPERFTTKGIETIRNHPSMTSYQFSAQYMMNPVPEEDQIFRPEYFTRSGFYYDELPDKLRIFVLVDPANTQRKSSDYTALMTIGIDESGDLYFIDIIRDKLTLDQRAKLVCDVLQRNKIHTVYYETIGFQSSDCKSIKEMGQQRDWYIGVEEIKASKQSKEDRIRGLQYFFEQSKVHFPRTYKYFSRYHAREFDMVEIFRRELFMFPSCEKDDLADCASFILRTNMLKASSYSKSTKTENMFDQVREFSINKGKPKKNFHGFGNKLNSKPTGIPAKQTLF